MSTPRMGFVGVSTGGSSIMRVFPAWADELGLPTRVLDGQDLPLDATPEQYRAIVMRYRTEPDLVGALVTTHKMGLYQAASDLFDETDSYAQRFGEVSSISKRDGRLIGHAKDPITAGLALQELLPPGHFARTGADVVCLGSGGAGLAIAYYLRELADGPRTITLTDTVPARLTHARSLLEDAFGPEGLRFVQVHGAADGDRLLAQAAPGSLIVNATGLGKDRPGSPISDAARFPEGGIAWEINYRGDLTFLQQAQAQGERLAVVADGWRYFIHGWSQVIAEVFGLTLDTATVDRLSELAKAAR